MVHAISVYGGHKVQGCEIGREVEPTIPVSNPHLPSAMMIKMILRCKTDLRIRFAGGPKRSILRTDHNHKFVAVVRRVNIFGYFLHDN